MRSNEPTDQEVLSNMHAFLNHLLKYVQNLVLLGPEGLPTKVATGFLLKKEGKCFLISAGHAIGRGGQWMIETPIVTLEATHSCSIRLDAVTSPSDFPVFAIGESGERIDLSWSEIHVQRLQEEFNADPLLADKCWQPLVYQGPLDLEPIPGEAYGYAAWNQATRQPLQNPTCAQVNLNTEVLVRKATFEIGMDFLGTDTSGLQRYKPTQPKDPNKQYHGASGAPIARPDGGIVAVAVRYDDKRHEILGVPLSKYAHLIGIKPRKGPDCTPIN